MAEQMVDLQEALIMLEKGYPLIIRNGQKRSEVFKINDRYRVKSTNYSVTLGQDQFLELYAESLFYYVEPQGESGIDDQKDDEEYYRWTHK